MKKKLSLLLFLITISFAFIASVKAESSITCTPTNAFIGDQITCAINTDEPVEVSSKLSLVAGDTTLTKNGNIVYKATNKGTYKVILKTIDPGFETSVEVIVTEKTTMTTTTTTKTKSDNNYLSSITVDGVELKDFSKTKTKYFIELENDVTSANISAKAEDENAKIEIDGPKTLKVGENEFTISVTSESNTTKFYKVIVTRKDEEESANTDIKNIKIKGYKLNFDKNSKTFYLNVNKEDTELDITVTLNDKNADYDIEGNKNLKAGSIIKIKVTAENGETDTYRIIIEKKESSVLPIIIGICILLVIIGIIVSVVIKKKKSKNNNQKKNKNVDKITKKPEEVRKSYDGEKTIEMPPINGEENQNDTESYEDEELVPVDNDEEEPTRMLSYAERQELERNSIINDDLENKLNEEINKTLSFDFDENNREEY